MTPADESGIKWDNEPQGADGIQWDAAPIRPTPVNSTAPSLKPPQERGFVPALTRGFKRSLPETESLLYGAGAAVAGAVGADGVRDAALNRYKDVQREDVAPLQTNATFMGALRGDDSLAEWAGDTLGNFGGQAVQSIAAAGAGALIGGASTGPAAPVGATTGAVGGLLARGAVKEIVEKSVAGMVAKGVAENAARQTVLRRLGGAAVAGTGLNIGQEVGIGYGDRATDAQAAGEQLTQADALRAIGYGIPAGLVDTAAEALTARLLTGVSASPARLTRMAGGAALGAVTEGGTEGIQAVMERAGAGRALTGEDATADYIENVAAGALGGSVPGAAGGIRTPAPAPPAGPAPPTAAPAAPAGPVTRAVQAIPPQGMSLVPPAAPTVTDGPMGIKLVGQPKPYGDQPAGYGQSPGLVRPAAPTGSVSSAAEALQPAAPDEAGATASITQAKAEGRTADAFTVAMQHNLSVNQAVSLGAVNPANQTIAGASSPGNVNPTTGEPSSPTAPATSDKSGAFKYLLGVLRQGTTDSSATDPTEVANAFGITRREAAELRSEAMRSLKAERATPSASAGAATEAASSSAGQVAPLPGAEPAPRQYDESPELLDSDIVFDDATPIARREDAEQSARQIGNGAKVFPVAGGFAIRKPLSTGAAAPTNQEPANVQSDTNTATTEPAGVDAGRGTGQPATEPAAVAGTDGVATGSTVQPATDSAAAAGNVVAQAANEAATSPTNDLPEPTDGQKKAGNYKLGHARVLGLDISIENPAGSVRRGVDKDGKAWEVPMQHHYGYFKGTIGKDKDHVDVFLTENAEDESRPVFVVDQNNQAGRFDEHKVILGAATDAEARAAYLANYSPGWKGLGGVTQMTQEQFKAWVKDPEHTKKRASAWKPAPNQTPQPQTPQTSQAAGNQPETLTGAPSKTNAAEQQGNKSDSSTNDTPAFPAPDANGIVTVKDAYGETVRVKQSDLDSGRNMLPTYDKNGKRKETTKGFVNILRANLDPDGSQRAAQPKPPTIGRRGAKNEAEEGFTSAESARKQIAKQGFNPDDYTIEKTRYGTFLGVLKKDTAASTTKALPNATAPEHVTDSRLEGVTVAELKEIAAEFRSRIDAGADADVTHIFDAPAKKDIVRLADKAKVYHKDHGWMTVEQAKAKIDEWEANVLKQGRDPTMRNANGNKVVLSLFDLSGKWSLPWEQAGYQVFRFDIQDESTYEDPETGEEKKVGDINNMSVEYFADLFGAFGDSDVYAILAACPCTDFAVSGARHFAAKDADGRTVSSIALVKQTMAAIEYFKPAVWALENPVGRIEDLTGLPPWRLSFDPNHLGDPYTKKTLIWGRFNADLPVAPVEPTEGSKMHKLYGGKSMATKNARSETPEGFAYAFFQANNAIDNPLMAVANKYDRLDQGAIKAALDAGVTPEEIDNLVGDFYYQDLDDEGANEALREAAAGTNQDLNEARDYESSRKAVVSKEAEKIRADEAPQLRDDIASLWEKYDGTGEISSVDDLANELESVLDEAVAAPKQLMRALNTYRDEQDEDRDLKGRNDMDTAEEAFTSAIRSWLAETPAAGKAATPKETSNEEPSPAVRKDPEARAEESTAQEGQQTRLLNTATETPPTGGVSVSAGSHTDPGEKPEPVTAEVINESLKTSAKKTTLNVAEAKAWLLGKIDAAIKAAPTREEMRVSDKKKADALFELGLTDAKDRDEQAQIDKRKAAAGKVIGQIVFDVPGDGKFTILNMKENLQAFREKVEKSPGFRKPAKRTAAEAVAPTSAGSSPATAIKDFIEAQEYANVHAYSEAIDKPLRYGFAANDDVPVAYALSEPVKIMGHEFFIGMVVDGKGAGAWEVVHAASGMTLGPPKVGKVNLRSKSDVLAAVQRRAAKELGQEKLDEAVRLSIRDGKPEAEREAKWVANRLVVEAMVNKADADLEETVKQSLAELKQNKSPVATVPAPAWVPPHIAKADAEKSAKDAAVAAPVSDSKPPAATEAPVAKITIATKTAKPAANTEDSGEELWANRRNSTGKGLNWTDIAGLNATLKAREAIKSKVWPRPDYEALIEGGIPAPIAHAIKQVYDAISVKPQMRGAPTDQQYQDYIAGVQKIQDAAFTWAKQVMAGTDALEKHQDRVKSLAAKYNLSEANTNAIVSALVIAEKGHPILESVFPMPEGSRSRWRGSDGKINNNNLLANLLGNKVASAMSIDSSSLHDASKAIEKGWPTPQEAWTRSFEIHKDEAGKRVFRRGREEVLEQDQYWISRGNRIVAEGFKTREEAEAAAKAAYEKMRKKGGDGAKAEAPVALQDSRTGPARRLSNEDITSDQLKETFGFKGINFGDWMKGSGAKVTAERQAHLNHAYDSLMDLAEILGLPPKALSLNGMLGLAIGAQGKGGKKAAAAHFVPGVNEINLTREQGAGSLAHEWAHAVDHYFAVQAGAHIATGKTPFLTEYANTKPEGVRPEIVAAFNTIVTTMGKRPETKAERDERFTAYKANVRRYLERHLDEMRTRLAADTKESDRARVLAEFDQLAARLNRGDIGEGYLATGKGTMDAAPQVVALVHNHIKDATGRRPEADHMTRLGHYARGVHAAFQAESGNAEHIPQLASVTSNFAREARKLEGTSSKRYWTTNLEMFARAFQSYVMDKLAASGARNDYLTRPQLDPETLKVMQDMGMGEDGDRYPRGAERERINAAFDVLTGEFKTRESDDGKVALFSRPDQPKSFAEQVRERLASGDRRGATLDMGRTPAVLRMLGVPDLSLKMPPGVLFKLATGKNAERAPLTESQIVRLPELLDEAVAVFDSATEPGSLVALLAQSDVSGNPIIASIDPNERDISAASVTVNILTSAYGKDGAQKWVDDQIAAGRLRYAQKQSPATRVPVRVQFPEGARAQGSGQSVLSDEDLRNFRAAARSQFSQPTDNLNPSGKGFPQTAAQVKDAIGAITRKWGNGPKVVVLDSAAGLPTRADGWQTAEGMYDPNTGTVYLVAPNLRNPNHTRTVLIHESVGHFGVEAITGATEWAKIRDTVAKMAADPKHAALFNELQRRGYKQGDATFVQEAVAVMAEKGVSNSVIDRVMSAMRRFLRSIGFELAMNERELRQHIVRAARFVERGAAQEQARGYRSAVDAEIKRVAAYSKPEMTNIDPDTLQDILTEHGQVPDTMVDAEKAWSDGDVFYASHELDEGGEPSRVTSIDMLRNYAPDQLISVRWQDWEAALAGLPLFSKADQTDTPAFKAWFGDSKVVDADGKPLVVYHGTRRTFDAFKPGFAPGWGVGVYFTDNREQAATEFGDNGRVVDAFVSIQNPWGGKGIPPGLEQTAAYAAISKRWPDVLDAWQEDSQFVGDALRELGYDGVIANGSNGIDGLEIVAFRREQIESATGNNGEFDPNNPSILFSRPDAAPGDVVLSEKAKESVKTFLDRVGAKLSDMKPALLGAIPLNYLADYAHKDMPAVKQFVDIRQQLEAFRNKKHQEFDGIAQEWLSYITKGGWRGWLGQQTERGKELSDLMHDTTIVGVDPTIDRAEYTDDADKLARYDELRRRYDAMPEEGQRLYRTTRDAYAKQARDVERALEDNLKKAADFRRDQADIAYTARLEDIADSNASAETKQAQREIAAKEHDRALKAATSSMSAKIIGLRKLFESMRVEAPYFPLKRFGSLFAAVRDADGNLLSFSKFENLADANAFAAEHKKQGHSVFIGADIEKETALSHIDPRFVAEVDEILAGLQPEGPTPGERFADGERMTAEDADKGDAMRDIRDAIYQRYLESLPDLSLRKSFIHRKKTPGYNPDALRSFASTMFHGSYQLARLKYGIDLQSALLAAQEQAKRADPVDGVRLANELAKRLAWIQNPAGGKAAQAITGAAFVWYLGANPAHLFLNATQTVMLGVPILGSKYGFTKTSRAFKEAAADFLRGKGHIEKARLSADERKAMQTFIDSGLIDKTQAHDLAGVGDTGAEYSALRSRVMGKIGWFFHQSERFNREVTALAAYRLARADGKIHDAAVKQAADHTWAIHFDYSAANRARYMQGDTAKVLTIFRNYNVNILYRLFRDIHTAFWGESKDAKIEAGKQLGAMMGMYGLMAGMAGMPFYGLLMMLASALDDDDEPFDAETRMKQGIVDLLGQDAAKVLLGGVPGALVGVDLSERIGMPNLWFRSPDRELEGRDAYFYWMEQIAGAGAGIPKSIFSGLQQINEGNVERGVESMLPNLAKSPVKAFRYAMQGQETNLDGDKLADIGTGGAIVRALGFTPASVAEQYDNNRALKSADAKLIKRRQQLMNRYAMALEMGDRDEVPGIIEAITRFNAINPAMAITRDTLHRSLKARARNDALNQGGIVMTPRLRALAERQGE